MLAVSLIVFVIAQDPEVDRCEAGMCGGPAMVSAFRQAVQRVLGSDTSVQAQLASSDPPDDEVASKAAHVDGLVELSFSPEGQRARLHCYVSRENRWLDREISFGERHGSAQSEISERGRLLGFAVATMYASDANDVNDGNDVNDRSDANDSSRTKPGGTGVVAAPPPAVAANVSSPEPGRRTPGRAERPVRREAEFGAIASAGLGGTASGVGASAGLRLGLSGPVWGRLFIAGRTGNIPKAQASTQTVLLGGGLALEFLPGSTSYQLGARLDAFAGYFQASHLSEDDIEPDRRSRWQLGGDLVAEAGWRLTPVASLFLGLGVEAMLGETAIYTHHNRVAVVPPLRVTAELGFRARF